MYVAEFERGARGVVETIGVKANPFSHGSRLVALLRAVFTECVFLDRDAQWGYE